MIMNLLHNLLLAVLTSTLIPSVSSQRTNVTCLPSMSWMSNQLGQNPCLVRAYLFMVCEPNTPYDTVVPLPDPSEYHYSGPSEGYDNPCQCSTVMYNMAQACGACQGGTPGTWLEWRRNCTTEYISIGTFPRPIPPGTAVPQWAFLNTSDSSFNVSAALQVAQEGHPDITSSNPENPLPTRGTAVGAIAGGVVGGVVGLTLLVLLGIFLFKRKRPSPPERPMSTAQLSYAPSSTVHSPVDEAFKYGPTNGEFNPVSRPPVNPTYNNTNPYWQPPLQPNRPVPMV